MRRFLAAALALPLLTGALTARAETFPFSIETGYRWFKINGNEDMYRTQINERSGFLIRSFNMSTSTPLADRLRIDVSDLGTGPAGALRLDAAQGNLYHLQLAYRQTNFFSALPAFANPLLGAGIIPGQHTYNRNRRMVDADLEFLPNGRFTPFLGYSFNRNNGPGTTTVTTGGDDFLLNSNLRDVASEYRVGAGFNTGMFYGSVTQGWRRQNTSQSFTLAPGAGGGNFPGSLLGRQITATSITRIDQTHVSTPFTNAYVTAQVNNRLRVIGNYVRFAADADATDSDVTAGSFVSFPLSRFFAGSNEQISSRAKNTTWRGGARGEFTVYDGVDLFAGFQRDHRSLDGSALINTLFQQTVTFGGVDPRDIQDVLNANSALDRDEDVLNAGVSARALGPFAIRAEFRDTKVNANVAPDLSEIVVPGNQGGRFDRRIHTFDTNANYSAGGFLIGAGWRKESANAPIFRTDFLDRDRIRARASWQTPANRFRVGVTAEDTKITNDQTGINYDAKLKQYAGDVEFSPVAALRLRGSLSQFRSDSTIPFRRPENFVVETSVHSENGKAREGGFVLNLKRASLDAGITRFENAGTIPFNIDRFRARLSFDLKAKTGLAAEWSKDKYSERNAAFADFDATRYGIFLRYTP